MGFDLSKKKTFAKDLYQYFTGAELSRNRNILMHNRMGIRIEMDIDLCNLVLWISPKAGKSLSYKDRNFSCRDDYTSVFDSIHFLDLSPEKFLKCEYAPFHSILHYKDKKIHILSLYDSPAVILKFEGSCMVNFKSDKADFVCSREKNRFIVSHPDRGYIFHYASVLTGASAFTHQLVTDEGRSTYARANMLSNDCIVIGAGLDDENISALMNGVADIDFDTLCKRNAAKVEDASKYGNVLLNGNDKLEKLLKLNKEILISAQDASGATQAALKRIYYLIWNRDGGMIWSLSSYAGLTWPLKNWTAFLLANPLEIDENGWKGKTFAQMVNGKISKWQEDGTFYAVWSAFTHWTQTWDNTFCLPQNIAPLEDSVTWMEEYCFDPAVGLFGRYYYCETPLEGSRDNGWDSAVGKPGVSSSTPYKKKDIVRSYDIYINAYMHSAYVMLTAMETEYNPKASKANLEKAAKLAEKMEPLFDKGSLPSYGYLKTKEDEIIKAPPYGMDECDYEWAMALAMFLRNPLEMKKYRHLVYKNITSGRRGGFVASKASVLSGMDTEFVDEKHIIDAILYIAKQSYTPGDYLVMPNTIIEIIGAKDGDIFHDVRPQMFSISAVLAAVSNLGVKKLPFGLAVRGTGFLKKIEHYEYNGGTIHFSYSGKGKIEKVLIDGKGVENSWQLPIKKLSKESTVDIIMSANANIKNTLIYSTVKLDDIDNGIFMITAYGQNQLLYKNLDSAPVIMHNGIHTKFSLTTEGEYSMIEFEGTGKHTVTL